MRCWEPFSGSGWSIETIYFFVQFYSCRFSNSDSNSFFCGRNKKNDQILVNLNNFGIVFVHFACRVLNFPNPWDYMFFYTKKSDCRPKILHCCFAKDSKQSISFGFLENFGTFKALIGNDYFVFFSEKNFWATITWRLKSISWVFLVAVMKFFDRSSNIVSKSGGGKGMWKTLPCIKLKYRSRIPSWVIHLCIKTV